jgi:hypothetical protein
MNRVCSALSALSASVLALSACTPETAIDDPEDYLPVVQLPDCRPNNDGVIEFSELPIVLNAVARVRVGTDVAVDVEGQVDDDGVRFWDLSLPAVETQPQGTFSAEAMEGQWFASLFPNADIAAPLVPGGSQLGPVIADEQSWRLLGAASKDEDPAEGKTQIVYDTPSVLYPFPLQLGTTVTTTSRARNALLLGVQTAFDDTVSVEVVRQGTVILPDLILDNTLQVKVKLERTLVAGDVQQVSYHFVHECLGEVARFTSPAVGLDEELDDVFPVAKEAWRLAL